MKVGLIDVDGHNFPNIPLMKLSAWHKAKGDHVEWYQPLLSGHMDIVYMAKVFSFSEDYAYPIDTDQLIKGGTGYHIKLMDGRESWTGTETNLPEEIEHMYPDYSLYNIKNTAYGFLSRGCPRGCFFCHVKSKEGSKSHKVANLSEFWHGQKNIQICDPNILACPDAGELLKQLADSKAWIDFNQGLDARLLTKEKLELLQKIKTKMFHFAWDNPKDGDRIIQKLMLFKEMIKSNRRNTICYCLTNFNSTLEEDLFRINTLRDLDIQPYVMIYDKDHADPVYRRMQRWCNAPWIFWSEPDFYKYGRIEK